MKRELFVGSESLAKSIVLKLIERSCFFQVDPLPEGKFAITVKEEQFDFVKSCIDKARDLWERHGVCADGTYPSFKVTLHNRA